MKTLVPSQQTAINCAVAKAMARFTFEPHKDYVHILDNGKVVMRYFPSEPEGIAERLRLAGVPNFCGSLDAMAEAEKTLAEPQDRLYKHYLAAICAGRPITTPLKDTDRLNCKALIKATRATASQRALAFLRTLGIECEVEG